MRTFLVECYAPGIEERDVAAAAARAREAVLTLSAGGKQLEYLGALFVAQDEVVFHAFSADDPMVVDQASQWADLRFERIVESVAVDGGGITGLSDLLTSLVLEGQRDRLPGVIQPSGVLGLADDA